MTRTRRNSKASFLTGDTPARQLTPIEGEIRDPEQPIPVSGGGTNSGCKSDSKRMQRRNNTDSLIFFFGGLSGAIVHQLNTRRIIADCSGNSKGELSERPDRIFQFRIHSS